MDDRLPATLPEAHRRFLVRAVELLPRDSRLVGLAAAGSFLTGSMDEFSDLDLVIAVEPDHLSSVMADRIRIAESLGPLLTAFTGEHVGEPRLVICLYGPRTQRVDLKFVALPDAAERVDDIAVLWERDGRLSAVLQDSTSVYPQPDHQWIEDRFWVWVHYTATKIGRGELYDAISSLSFLRSVVLGPLGLKQAGQRPAGVRRLEQLVPELAVDLEATLPQHEAASCFDALRRTIDIYRRLRAPTAVIVHREEAERAVLDYLNVVEGSSIAA